MIAFLNDYSKEKTKIESHSSPNEKRPKRVSKLRALAVKNYLVEKGIDPKRIEIESFGASSPMVPNSPLCSAP